MLNEQQIQILNEALGDHGTIIPWIEVGPLSEVELCIDNSNHLRSKLKSLVEKGSGITDDESLVLDRIFRLADWFVARKNALAQIKPTYIDPNCSYCGAPLMHMFNTFINADDEDYVCSKQCTDGFFWDISPEEEEAICGPR